MKQSDTAENEISDLLQKKDFGLTLRQAREKSGMSQAEVAQDLLISVDIIKALENSQAEALPALAFTQGYIRSYARLLGISADEIIDDYALMAPDSKQMLTPNSVLPAQKCCNDKVVKLISFGFVVVAISVLIYWLLNADFKMPETHNSTIAEFNKQSMGVNKDENNASRFSDSHFSADAKESMSSENNNSLPLKKTIIEKNQPADLKHSEAVIAQEAPVAVADKKTSIQQPAKDILILSALGDSWSEIQDSTGKRLYYQLINTGNEVKLLGTAPFIVFLGNAPKVRVEVNNKIVDFESLINKNSNIASLKISKDAAVIPFSNH